MSRSDAASSGTGGRDQDHSRSSTWCAVVALVWAVGAGVVFLVVPTGQSVSTSLQADGTEIVESARYTLVESEGLSVLAIMAVPVLITAAGVVASRSSNARRGLFTAGGVLVLACMLAAASLGLFYAPSALALLLAGRLSTGGRDGSRVRGRPPTSGR